MSRGWPAINRKGPARHRLRQARANATPPRRSRAKRAQAAWRPSFAVWKGKAAPRASASGSPGQLAAQAQDPAPAIRERHLVDAFLGLLSGRRRRRGAAVGGIQLEPIVLADHLDIFDLVNDDV